MGLLGRNQAELDSTRLEIEYAGGPHSACQADVCNPDEIQTAVSQMTSLWGGINALIACAGVLGRSGPFLRTVLRPGVKSST